MPAPPDAWWPSGETKISARVVPLSTGIGVRVVSAGPESGPPLLLVHGWGIHAYLWRRNIDAFAGAGYRVHAIDLPGHGLSDRPMTAGSYALAAMTSHLAAALDALRIDSATVIAHSMGGRIASELARTMPSRVTRLALIGSVGFGEVPRFVALAPSIPAPRGPLSAALIRRWMVALGKAFAYGRRAKVQQEDVDAYWAATQLTDFVPAMRQALIEFDWRVLSAEQLAGIVAPTRVIFGTRDRTVNPAGAEALVRGLPRGTISWIRDAGHLPNEEAPEEVNSLLLEFIAGRA